MIPGADQGCSTARAHMDSPAQVPGTRGWLGGGQAGTTAWLAAQGADGAISRGAQTTPHMGQERGGWCSSPPAPTGSVGTGRQPGKRLPHPPCLSKHRCPQSCVGASPAGANMNTPSTAGGRKAPEMWVQAGSAVCLQAVSGEVFLEGH